MGPHAGRPHPHRAETTTTPTHPDAIGFINPDELYTLSAFCRRLGITAATLRSARRAGLRVYYAHKHGYIHDRDWIDYVRGTAGKALATPQG